MIHLSFYAKYKLDIPGYDKKARLALHEYSFKLSVFYHYKRYNPVYV